MQNEDWLGCYVRITQNVLRLSRSTGLYSRPSHPTDQRLYEGGVWEMKYSNPAWEPYFKDISPALSKLYFLTNSGTIRYIVATMIFKKMGRMERRNGNGVL